MGTQTENRKPVLPDGTLSAIEDQVRALLPRLAPGWSFDDVHLEVCDKLVQGVIVVIYCSAVYAPYRDCPPKSYFYLTLATASDPDYHAEQISRKLRQAYLAGELFLEALA